MGYSMRLTRRRLAAQTPLEKGAANEHHGRPYDVTHDLGGQRISPPADSGPAVGYTSPYAAVYDDCRATIRDPTCRLGRPSLCRKRDSIWYEAGADVGSGMDPSLDTRRQSKAERAKLAAYRCLAPPGLTHLSQTHRRSGLRPTTPS